jgi:hypothetical protein
MESHNAAARSMHCDAGRRENEAACIINKRLETKDWLVEKVNKQKSAMVQFEIEHKLETFPYASFQLSFSSLTRSSSNTSNSPIFKRFRLFVFNTSLQRCINANIYE